MSTFAFNYWIEAARDQLESSSRYTFASVRAPLLRTARSFLRLALAEANKLRDRPVCGSASAS